MRAQVAYYISQSKANNHAVREAACAVIAELLEKIDKAAVAPHVAALLRALILCFKDMSWPVRDAACVACGRWVEDGFTHFFTQPQRIRSERMPVLLQGLEVALTVEHTQHTKHVR